MHSSPADSDKASEMDVDDDEIVEEIPVYLSKTLANQLYVLQYPNKKLDNNLDKAEVTKSCVKPINQEFKIDFTLDTASRHYDAFKGEQFAIAADGKDNRGEKMSFRSGTMDRQSYISTKPMDTVNKYLVGYMQDKEIHVSLVEGIIQMRPSFSYFDKLDTRKKAEQKHETESDMDEEEPKHVTVKFARNETDKVRKAREKSFNYLTKKSADEPWHETMWYPKDSVQAQLERQKLFSISSETTGHALSLTSGEYIETLIPAERYYSNLDALLPARVISMAKLKSLSLSDQIENILKDAKVVALNTLVELIDGTVYSEEKILRTLPTVGLLIHGNWVIQSEILYPSKSVSSTNGVSAELMCRARDYILYQFYRNEIIDRKKISSVVQIPSEEVKEILLTVAKWNSKSGWKLLLPPNLHFDERYQELKQRQDVFWRAKDEMFQELESEAKSPRRKRKISAKSESK